MLRRVVGVLVMAAAGANMASGQAPATNANVRLGALLYSQYMYTLTDSGTHREAFDVTRAYVTLLGQLPSGVGGRVTLDLVNAQDAPVEGGLLALQLKYAYASYTPPASGIQLKLGALPTAFLEWEESLWGYRVQGTMPMERAKYLTSSGLGLGLDGAWGGNRLNIQGDVVNTPQGANINGVPFGRDSVHKQADLRVSFRLAGTDDTTAVGGLRVTGFTEYRGAASGGRQSRLVGLASYRTSLLTLAAEFGSINDSTFTNAFFGTPSPATPARVMSAYGSLRLKGSGFGFVGRVDDVNTNTRINPDSLAPGVTYTASTLRLILGVSYEVSPELKLLADFDQLSYPNAKVPPATPFGNPFSPNGRAGQTQSSVLFQAQLVL